MSQSGSAKPARTRARRPRVAKESTPTPAPDKPAAKPRAKASKPAVAPAPAAATPAGPTPAESMVGPGALERATELGYFGENPMATAIPNEHYALTTGPDGVSADHERAVAARLLAESLVPSDGKAS